MSILPAKDSGKTGEPDFAFPQTVLSDAQNRLEQYDKIVGENDGALRLRAMLEIMAAGRLIDPDTAFTFPAFIEKQLSKKGLSAADKAMLTLLEAETFRSIYRHEQYKYDRVDAPLEPFPADISLWSGKQFAHKIDALYSAAAALAAGDTTPLSRYGNCLEYNEYGLLYIPDVLSFVNLKTYGWKNGRDLEKGKEFAADVAATLTKGSAPWCYWACMAASGNRNALLKLYSENASAPEARFILSRISGDNIYITATEVAGEEEDDNSGNADLIGLIESSLKQFPDWYDNNSLRNTLASMRQPRLSASAPNLLGPGMTLKIDADAKFCKKLTFKLYRLPANKAYSIRTINAGNPISERTVTSLPDDSTFTVEFPVEKAGYYAWTASINGATPTTSGTFEVVPIYPVALDGLKNQYVIVTDINTGAPVKDVEVILNGKNWRNNSTMNRKLGTTDAQGFRRVNAEPDSVYNSQWLTFRHKGSLYTFNERIRTYKPGTFTPTANSVEVFTDRSLYHQGDTVRWAVVATDKNTVAEGQTVKLTLFDANYQKVEERSCILDAFGRAEGSFVTKKDVLTGSWRINAQIGDARANTYIKVSDFRLPTFRAEVTSVERDVAGVGTVRLSGTAITFSGMPVAGAQVKLTLSKAQRWRWFSPQEYIGELNGTTDAAGAFTFDISADMLAKGKDFLAEITVTAKDGAASDTMRSFTTGKPYSLQAECNTYADNGSPVAVKFLAYDANGESAAIPVKWQVGIPGAKGLKKVLAEGNAVSGESSMLNLSALAAGEYTIRVAAADSALADAVNAATVVLFNEKKNEVPDVNGRLFIPTNSVIETTDNYGTAEILVGISGAPAYVNVVTPKEKGILALYQKQLQPGFHRIKVSTNGALGSVSVFCVSEARFYQKNITLVNKKTAGTEIIAESFRDKLTPGQNETWRFRLAGADGKTLDAAMIATLYNRALDELYTTSWPGHLRKYFSEPVYNLRLVSPGSGYNAFISESIKYKVLKSADVVYPAFRYRDDVLYIRGTGPIMRSMKAEAASADRMTLNSVATAGFAADDYAYEIKSEVEEAEEDGTIEESRNFEYRVAEVLQAFWQPSLTSDKDGNIDITFTVPNANGSWTFKSFAWSKELESASYIAECMSNKPVMVQPNLPRYLRQGDKARVLATVYNNSDESTDVTTVIEIFDIASGKVISTDTQSNTIAAKGSATVGIEISAPVDASAIGYRVRSQAGIFADGEQSFIPVLSSSATVVESTEFYLNPDDSKPFSLKLKAASDASVTLQYCQNPVWTAVKAMRGLAGLNLNTANGYSAALFSALAAGKIIADNPAVADVIRTWKENPGEGALTSMLEKNSELKLLLLDQTPWVQTAADESSRMAMLADVLDPAAVAKSVTAYIAELAKLQNPDGGFAWTSWCRESSVWSTENVLIHLGIANSLGMLPDDSNLRDMAQKAFNYLAAEAKRPNRPKTDTGLAYIAAALPWLDSSAAKAIITATESAIINGWKKGSVLDKAWDILIVRKNYRRTAEQMLASIRQFAVAKAGKGLAFPSVNDIRAYATIIQAYAVMDAPQKEIDALRQWVLVQGQASDDFGAANPDYVIAALMLTGSLWTDVPVQQNVTVNGKPLAIGNMESATGYFSQKLDVSGNFTISVTPNGVTPSYGSVVSIDRRPMTKIKARPGRDISIEKRVLVQRDGEWVQTNSFALGERLRVQLIIKTSRDLDYVCITDERPAAFEPVEQLPGYVYDGGVAFYRENLDATTRLAIGRLAKGSYHISYDMTANVAGTFISGIATLQSQYAPELTAHSGGNTIEVK